MNVLCCFDWWYTVCEASSEAVMTQRKKYKLVIWTIAKGKIKTTKKLTCWGRIMETPHQSRRNQQQGGKSCCWRISSTARETWLTHRRVLFEATTKDIWTSSYSVEFSACGSNNLSESWAFQQRGNKQGPFFFLLLFNTAPTQPDWYHACWSPEECDELYISN